MTDWYCSVCFTNKGLTKVAGTIICQECLKKVSEQNRNNDETLKEDLIKAIVKENDIYD